MPLVAGRLVSIQFEIMSVKNKEVSKAEAGDARMTQNV